MSIFKLVGRGKVNHWGDSCRLSSVFHLGIQHDAESSELVYSAHPLGDGDVRGVSGMFHDLLARSPTHSAGTDLFYKYGGLPFQLKLFAVASAQPVRISPSERDCENGYVREERLGIKRNDIERCYPDPFCSERVLYSISSGSIFLGLRPAEEVLNHLRKLSLKGMGEPLRILAADPTTDGLYKCLQALYSLGAPDKENLITSFLTFDSSAVDCVELKLRLNMCYALSAERPMDLGCLSPLFMHDVSLNPGDAVVVTEGVPFFAVCGLFLEASVQSECSVPVALAEKVFPGDAACFDFIIPTSVGSFRIGSEVDGDVTRYPLPVSMPFEFELIRVDGLGVSCESPACEIVVCLTGEVRLELGEKTVFLYPGQASFVSKTSGDYCLRGGGEVARVYAR